MGRDARTRTAVLCIWCGMIVHKAATTLLSSRGQLSWTQRIFCPSLWAWLWIKEQPEQVSVQTNGMVFIDVLQDGSLNVLLDHRVSATLRETAEFLVTGTITNASPHVPRAADVSCFNCCLSSWRLFFSPFQASLHLTYRQRLSWEACRLIIRRNAKDSEASAIL